MLFPSASIIAVGTLLSTVMLLVDWYVWGLNLAADPRQPRRIAPLTGLELIDLGLARLTMTNRAVLPKAAFEPVRPATAATDDPGDGFKRVA